MIKKMMVRYEIPSFSQRVIPIYFRNLLVWKKLFWSSVLGNIADPLISLLAFGYGFGRFFGTVEGLPYIVFLAAGAVCSGTMMAASFESLFSAFARMHQQRTWDSLINAPVDLDDVVIAEWLWAATKGSFSGIAIFLVMGLLGGGGWFWGSPLVLVFIFLTGLCFSAIGLCFNAVAKSYNSFTFYMTLVLTPMTFLSGVYYPVSAFPPALLEVSNFLPLTAAVRLVRPLVAGYWPEDFIENSAILCVYSVAALYAAVVLTRRRFES